MSQPPAVEAASDRLRGEYERAWNDVQARLNQIADDPLRYRERARLRRITLDITRAMSDLDRQATIWANTELPGVYQLGAQPATEQLGLDWQWTQAHREAVDQLAGDLMDDLLAATAHVNATTKTLVREIGKAFTNRVIVQGMPAQTAGREMRRLLEQHKVSAIIYRDGSRHGLAEYSNMAVRTKSAQTYNVGALTAGRTNGVAVVEGLDGIGCGLTSHDDGNKVNGNLFPIEDAFRYPLSHPNCVIEGTPFTAYGKLEELVRARYDGPVFTVTVATPTGLDSLTVGPNHPLLTRSGWVPAHLLAEGDELVHDALGDDARDGGLELHHEQMPRVEDVFRALRGVGPCARVPASSDDLHGDAVFSDGEIEVVRPARQLLDERHSPVAEHAGERDFVWSDPDLEGVPGLGVRQPLLVGNHASPAGGVGRVEHGGSLLVRDVLPAQAHGLGQGAADPEGAQRLANRSGGDAYEFGDLRAGQSLVDVPTPETLGVGLAGTHASSRAVPGRRGPVGGGAELDAAPDAPDARRLSAPVIHGALERAEGLTLVHVEPGQGGAAELAGREGRFHLVPIVRIERSRYTGWVYDATTSRGCFVAGSIIAKNCRRSWGMRPDMKSVTDRTGAVLENPPAAAAEAQPTPLVPRPRVTPRRLQPAARQPRSPRRPAARTRRTPRRATGAR